MKCALIILMIIVVQGCATTLTQEEQDVRDYNRQIDLQNWNMCERVYLDSHIPTIHFNHTHTKPMSGNRLAEATRSDLIVNQCRMILRGYWADRI